MAKQLHAICWFEPYWSYRKDGNIKHTNRNWPNMLNYVLFLILAVAVISAVIVFTVDPDLFISRPDMFSDAMSMPFIWCVYGIAFALLVFITLKFLTPFLDWIVPRYILDADYLEPIVNNLGMLQS